MVSSPAALTLESLIQLGTINKKHMKGRYHEKEKYSKSVYGKPGTCRIFTQDSSVL
jgi:hypothetical protein